jgi:hypothetical protein
VTYDAQWRRVTKRHRPGTRGPPNKRSNPGGREETSPESDGAGNEGDSQQENAAGRTSPIVSDAEAHARAEAVRAAATAAAMADYFEGGEPFLATASDEEEDLNEPRPTRWNQRNAAAYKQYMEQRPSLAQVMLRGLAIPEVAAECSRPGCSQPVAMKCRTCGLVCGSCDRELHPHAHFHHRWFLRDGQC